MGEGKRNLRPRQPSWQLTNYTRTHQYTWMRFKSRRCFANISSTRTFTKWRLRKHQHSIRYILKMCLCMQSIQSNSRHYSQSYHRLHDKTCALTYCIDNGQKLSFGLQCITRNIWCLRYHTLPCNHETCTNHRILRKKACHDEDITENVFRRISHTMAQTLTISSFRLQHNVSHEYRIWTGRVFHGQLPYNILDHKLGLTFKTN